MDVKMSLYKSKSSKENNDIAIDDYVNFVRIGTNQDLVLQARATLQKGDEEGYRRLKSKSMCVTGSCTILPNHSKDDKNIAQMNGLIVVDIDDQLSQDQYDRIRNDKYTHIIHRSFSGTNFCVFIKIDPEKFRDSFDCIADYYFSQFGLCIDQSCKNRNRLRYLSYDPDIYVNDKSSKFVARNIKKYKEIDSHKTNYVFHEDDFDNILRQIRERNIDLCREEYVRYVRIGMALASQFGAAGSEKFHFVCQFGGKYDQVRAEKDYKGFVSNSQGKCTIGTFYYYCKEEGLDIYTDKTKQIINRVKVAKSQGKPDKGQILSTLKVLGVETNERDLQLIETLIKDKTDYSASANEEVSEIEQIEQFIIDAFDPQYDQISHKIYLKNRTILMTDVEINDIYISCKKSFDFNVTKTDVISILSSSSVARYNPLTTFLENNEGDPQGYIDEYIDCISPGNEYFRWAFKKWIVGAVHNWTRGEHNLLVCPLTLVLTGPRHGTGKTSFIRHVLPPELRNYFIEGKINGNDKDSMFRLCTSLISFDDEFGGTGVKDSKAFKSISDTNNVTQRRPYGTGDMTFRRRAILAGTSNEMDILKDVTGNRRLLPIQVKDDINYAKITTIDTGKMIVEAYNLLKSGFNWIVRTQEDIDYIKENSAENETVLPIEEVFFNHFSLERQGEFILEEVLNQGEILEYLNIHSPLKPSKFDLQDVYKKNNMVYRSYRIGGASEFKKGFRLYKKPLHANEAKKEDDPF